MRNRKKTKSKIKSTIRKTKKLLKKNRSHTNPNFEIFHNLRSRLHNVLRGIIETSSTKTYFELILNSVEKGLNIK